MSSTALTSGLIGAAVGAVVTIVLAGAFVRRKDGLPMLPEKMASLITSRRFWLLIAGVVLELSNGRIVLSPDAIHAIVAVLGAWIVGDSLRKTEIKDVRKLIVNSWSSSKEEGKGESL